MKKVKIISTKGLTKCVQCDYRIKWIKNFDKIYIYYECKCRFDGKKCNSDQLWNNNKCRNKCKKCHVCENDYIWNPATCSCEKEHI